MQADSEGTLSKRSSYEVLMDNAGCLLLASVRRYDRWCAAFAATA